eukprot:TRINITY_DN5936_c0_g1_i8.p2 TRINITY_DN5936_c0_g1~~TRINITY_DN5936_c0_g1_i8.p2  ORF type:complete len:176 (+),score=12.26 TRINITY_DN5936_c0_g1_i8:912-1439(+)
MSSDQLNSKDMLNSPTTTRSPSQPRFIPFVRDSDSDSDSYPNLLVCQLPLSFSYMPLFFLLLLVRPLSRDLPLPRSTNGAIPSSTCPLVFLHHRCVCVAWRFPTIFLLSMNAVYTVFAVAERAPKLEKARQAVFAKVQAETALILAFSYALPLLKPGSHFFWLNIHCVLAFPALE